MIWDGWRVKWISSRGLKPWYAITGDGCSFPDLSQKLSKLQSGCFPLFFGYHPSLTSIIEEVMIVKTWKSFYLLAVCSEYKWHGKHERTVPFSFRKSRMPLSLTCAEFSSRTISTFPLGLMRRKWSYSHVINTTDITWADFSDIVTVEPCGKPSSNTYFLLTPVKMRAGGRKRPSALQQAVTDACLSFLHKSINERL